jgi:hypothetical protein
VIPGPGSPACTIDELLKDADALMYRDKLRKKESARGADGATAGI